MASPAKVTMLSCILWLVLHLVLDFGKAQTCISSTEQPVVNSIDPPSGTTGTDAALSTRYTITGQRLDQVMAIFVEIQTLFERLRIDAVDPTVQGTTSISFHPHANRFFTPRRNRCSSDGGSYQHCLFNLDVHNLFVRYRYGKRQLAS